MISTRPTITFIGAGNMGSALLAGLIANGHPPSKLWACDPSMEKLAALEKQWGIRVSTHNQAAAQDAEVVIFAVKPQLFAPVALALAPQLQTKKPLVISIAAGIREENIQEWLGGGMAIIRSMPNMPALLSCGATGLYANRLTSAAQKKLAESILNCVGITVWVNDEKQMDTITALSGSGPAYFFLVMEALQQAAEELGLPAASARVLTLQTAYGAARLALESKEEITTLRQQVTSPGGTTERALQVLEKGKLRQLLREALVAAEKRAQELSQQVAKP